MFSNLQYCGNVIDVQHDAFEFVIECCGFFTVPLASISYVDK